jgi:hippurate hydrolase
MMHPMQFRCVFLIALSTSLIPCFAPTLAADVRATVKAQVNQRYPALLELYKHLHAHPELSLCEEKTSARLADELRRAGYEVTTTVGGYGVVAVLKNGAGPTVLVRADIDALPVKEQTGLPYASAVTAKDPAGKGVNVMHACGHDVHMTCLVGTAQVLAQLKDRWHGTLVLIAQPAEELGGGAQRMLADGLFTRFPRPDYCLALHDTSDVPAGAINYTPGFSHANVDSVDITVRGVGGHGAHPYKTKDPVVLASQIVLALQTIVSREVKAGEPAVVTVGSIHGGTKHNIIPDEVKLQLTVRSYADEVRKQVLDAIPRIVRGQAIAAGIPDDRMPIVEIEPEYTPAVYNDPKLTMRLVALFRSVFGEANVIEEKPSMGGEDFGEYGRTEHKIPICMFAIGVVPREEFEAAQHAGKPLPGLHSPLFAPAPEPTLKTGITAMTAAVLELMGGK